MKSRSNSILESKLKKFTQIYSSNTLIYRSIAIYINIEKGQRNKRTQ